MGHLLRTPVAAILVVACGSTFEGGTENGVDAHAPASPSFGSDAAPDELAPPDVWVPDVADAAADTGSDAVQACPLDSCDGGMLIHWILIGATCFGDAHPCPFGCADDAGSPACASPDPESPCTVGMPEGDAGSCWYKAKTLCFDTFEAACACAGCTIATCAKAGKRLKIPKCLSKSCAGDASSEASSTVDSGDASLDADAAAEGTGAADAAPTATYVVCK